MRITAVALLTILSLVGIATGVSQLRGQPGPSVVAPRLSDEPAATLSAPLFSPGANPSAFPPAVSEPYPLANQGVPPSPSQVEPSVSEPYPVANEGVPPSASQVEPSVSEPYPLANEGVPPSPSQVEPSVSEPYPVANQGVPPSASQVEPSVSEPYPLANEGVPPSPSQVEPSVSEPYPLANEGVPPSASQVEPSVSEPYPLANEGVPPSPSQVEPSVSDPYPVANEGVPPSASQVEPSVSEPYPLANEGVPPSASQVEPSVSEPSLPEPEPALLEPNTFASDSELSEPAGKPYPRAQSDVESASEPDLASSESYPSTSSASSDRQQPASPSPSEAIAYPTAQSEVESVSNPNFTSPDRRPLANRAPSEAIAGLSDQRRRLLEPYGRAMDQQFADEPRGYLATQRTPPTDTGATTPNVDGEGNLSGTPWWRDSVAKPRRPGSRAYQVGVDTLILAAVRHSPRVRAISQTPRIAELQIMEAQGQFDLRGFMDNKFSDLNEPVGSSLTTGGPPRLEQKDWSTELGVRKRTVTGGQFEVAQGFGIETSNSRFFEPADQGNARLSLSFSQPLLRGSGRAYNTSQIVLARIESGVAWDQFANRLEDHLVEVAEAYWELYLQRSILTQRETHYRRADSILRELKQRRVIDTLPNQVAQAEAALASRHAELIRAETAIRNAEAKIRALVAAPELIAGRAELLPIEFPLDQPLPSDLRKSVQVALEHRTEIDQAIRKIKAAQLRLNITKNELLPAVNFVVETYMKGLEGNKDVGHAWTNQVNEGQPTWSTGLTVDWPFANNEAKARNMRSHLQLRQAMDEFRDTTGRLVAEVEMAHREVDTTYREMRAKVQAAAAAAKDNAHLQRRWEVLFGEERAAGFVLQDLLDAQQRLANAEAEVVRFRLRYALSITSLKQATGTLLKCENVTTTRRRVNGLPEIQVRSGPQ